MNTIDLIKNFGVIDAENDNKLIEYFLSCLNQIRHR